MSEQLREALQGLVDLRGHGSWSKKWDEAWDAAYAALSTHHAVPGAPQQEASGGFRHIGFVRFDSRAVKYAAVDVMDVMVDSPIYVIDRAAATAPAGGVTDEREAMTAAYMAFCKHRAPDHNEVGFAYFKAAWEGRAALTTAARAAEPGPGDRVAALPFAIFDDELSALHRFYETTEDGQDYDVPVPMMKRLAVIGLVRRVTGNRYEFTDFGLSVCNGDFATSPPTGTGTSKEGVEHGA